jgi:hypothetical protein
MLNQFNLYYARIELEWSPYKFTYDRSNLHPRWPLLLKIEIASWRPVSVVEEAGIPGENHRPWASNW